MTGPRQILTAFSQLLKRSSTSIESQSIPNQIVQGPIATAIQNAYDKHFQTASQTEPFQDALILQNLSLTSEESQALTLKRPPPKSSPR